VMASRSESNEFDEGKPTVVEKSPVDEEDGKADVDGIRVLDGNQDVEGPVSDDDTTASKLRRSRGNSPDRKSPSSDKKSLDKKKSRSPSDSKSSHRSLPVGVSSERKRSRSRERGKRIESNGADRKVGRKRSRSGSRSRSASRHRIRDGRETEMLDITDDDASFVLGTAGRTKRKLSRVCGAELNITECKGKTVLEIKGTADTRERARLYVGYVMQQRVGPVNLKYEPEDRDDLTCIEVPHECVGYVTGRRGQGLRSIEEEWCTLMFFTDLRSQKAGETEKLAIFGTERARRGAELKVMSAVEQKMPGYFTKTVRELLSEEETFSTDSLPISEEDYSYALGKEGSTRKKLARASGAILEYVGRIAFIAGTKVQRRRAREYLQWLCAQRTQYVHVATEGRDDCTVVHVPTNCVAYVTGTKGNALRRIEELTGSFIFLDGTRGNDSERLLIFGSDSAGRVRAKDLVDERIDDKLTGRSRYMNNRGSGRGGRGGGYGRSRSRSYSRGRDHGHRRRRSYSRSRSRGRSASRSRSPPARRNRDRYREKESRSRSRSFERYRGGRR